MSKKVRFIYNPTAGNGHAAKVFETLRPYLDHVSDAHIEVFETVRPGHATELAREVAEENDMTVVSLGGDGTHHEVVNGLMPSGKAILGIIPAGTGNDFVRALAYPRDPQDILNVVLNGSTQWFDLGLIDQQYFLTVAGIGFDAEVAGWVNKRKKEGNGTWVFIRGILYNLLGYRSQKITVTTESFQRTEDTFMISFGNTAYYAGGMNICPGASPCDGQFNVVWVKRIAPWSAIPLLTAVFHGHHVLNPHVETLTAQDLTIDGPPQLWVHADGELLGHLPIHVRTIPHAIRVRVGAQFQPTLPL
ncbi:MAG: diacylglycerol kinase family lipid kinase [Firmicutes bacterium]|nr:diacylglycerol kinase family lipid kinase [Bacillota bacterium]